MCFEKMMVLYSYDLVMGLVRLMGSACIKWVVFEDWFVTIDENDRGPCSGLGMIVYWCFGQLKIVIVL